MIQPELENRLSAADSEGRAACRAGDAPRPPRGVWNTPQGRFAVAAGVLTLGFSWPLIELVRFALDSSLFSHVLLVPLVSWYLIRQRWDKLSAATSQFSTAALLTVLTGWASLAVYWTVWRPDGMLATTDRLAVLTSAYLLLLIGAAWICLGTTVIRAWSFPLGFLVFMVPWPTGVIDGVEIALQYASAEAAAVLLRLSGTPFLRDGLVFELPGIVIQVAQECSGVRSTYVLLITSVLAAHLLVRSPWKQWLLVFVVIPLGIARNGLRILTISLLCVHVSPEMIDSPIHHRGGPIFFALSLVPFFLLLWWLRRKERP